MKTIMLVCNAGMSTSMLVTKMLKAAEKKNIGVNIFAVPMSEVESSLKNENVDVILVGPQVKFMKREYEEKYTPEIKIDDINMKDYGTMNGESVLKSALQLIEE